MSPVDQALVLVRQLAARPGHVFDPYALIGALENLEDVARRAAHPDVRRFTAVLSNCKKLSMNPTLGDFVTQVLGDEVEKEVAKMMVKVYKPTSQPIRVPSPQPAVPGRFWPYPRMEGSRPPLRCFACRRLGHMVRDCPQRGNR